MLTANPYDEQAAFRILEYCQPKPAWQRQLWSVGTVLQVRESLEAADAHAGSILSDAAARYIWNTAAELAISDPGVGPMATRHLIRNCLNDGLVAGASEYHLLVDELADFTNQYCSNWAAHAQLGVADRRPPEDLARFVASHLLDLGFSQQFLFDFLNERIIVAADVITLGDLLNELGVLAGQPDQAYRVMVAFDAAPIKLQQLPPSWRTSGQVSHLLRANGFQPVVQAGGLELEIRARDPWAAVERATSHVDAIKARFAIGTSRVFRPRGEAWILGHPHPFILQHRKRNAEIGSIERSGKLYSTASGNAVDAALELLAPINEALAPSAISAGWAAIEALLVRPDDKDRGVTASDRLAWLVACSVPRAELTTLAYKHMANSVDALSSNLAAAKANREKARLVADAVANNVALTLSAVADTMAMERVKAQLADPKRHLTQLQQSASESFRRLYRQRNLVMHWGKTDSVAAEATLRTSVGILGAGIDRIAHSWFVGGVAPWTLAARARQRLQVAGQQGFVGLVDLLE